MTSMGLRPGATCCSRSAPKAHISLLGKDNQPHISLRQKTRFPAGAESHRTGIVITWRNSPLTYALTIGVRPPPPRQRHSNPRESLDGPTPFVWRNANKLPRASSAGNDGLSSASTSPYRDSAFFHVPDAQVETRDRQANAKQVVHGRG